VQHERSWPTQSWLLHCWLSAPGDFRRCNAHDVQPVIHVINTILNFFDVALDLFDVALDILEQIRLQRDVHVEAQCC
jgi:hypothetical protein